MLIDSPGKFFPFITSLFYLDYSTKVRIILILDPMESIEKSDKTPNYKEKLSVIISKTVPKYLLQYFIESWNAKFPEQIWKSGSVSSGNDLVNAIPEQDLKGKDLKKFNGYKDKLHCGNEQEWDTDILVHILVDFGLDICETSVKRDLVQLRKAISHFTPNKPCSPAESDKMMMYITGAAKKLFQKDAEDEIFQIWHSEIESPEADEQSMQPSTEMKSCIESQKVVKSGTEHTSGKLLFKYSVLLCHKKSPLILFC